MKTTCGAILLGLVVAVLLLPETGGCDDWGKPGYAAPAREPGLSSAYEWAHSGECVADKRQSPAPPPQEKPAEPMPSPFVVQPGEVPPWSGTDRCPACGARHTGGQEEGTGYRYEWACGTYQVRFQLCEDDPVRTARCWERQRRTWPEGFAKDDAARRSAEARKEALRRIDEEMPDN